MLGQLSQISTNKMILMENSLTKDNVEKGKNAFTSVMANILELFENPGKMAYGSAYDYMHITEWEASILTKILEILSPLALSLVVVFVVVHLIQQYSALNNQISLLIMVKAGLLLCTAVILLDHVGAIVSIFCDLSNAFAQQIMEGISESKPEELEELLEKVRTMNEQFNNADFATFGGTLIQSLIFLLIGGITKVVNSLAGLITSVVVYAAKIELLIRFAFVPIALAGFASEDHRHQAMHYVRKCVASAMYCGAIVVLMYIANLVPIANAMGQITDVVNAEGAGETALEAAQVIPVMLNCVLMSIIGPFSAIGAISTVKSTINEAIGA